MKNRISFRLGVISISAGSVLLGGMGIFVRLAGNAIQPMAQTFGRIFVAFIFISILNLFRNKLKKETLSIKRKDLPYFLLNGLIGFSVMASAFTLSILYTSISNTYFLLYTAPIFAVIFSAIFLKEKINENILIAIAISLIGLIFLFNPTNLSSNLFGNIFGLITGISFGAYFVITNYLGRNYNSSTITFWMQFFGSLFLFPLIFIFDKPLAINFDIASWTFVILGGIVVLAGYYLLNFGLTKISSTVGSILSLFEPLSAAVFGLLFFVEIPTLTTFVGAFFILLSITYLTFSQSRLTAQSEM